MNCANAPCETCQWKDTCERYIEQQDIEEMLAWMDYEQGSEEDI